MVFGGRSRTDVYGTATLSMCTARLFSCVVTVYVTLCLASCVSSDGIRRLSPDDIPVLTRQVEKDTLNAAAHSDLGALLMHARRYDEAGTYLTRALELDSTALQTRFYLGLYLENQQRGNEAIPLYASYADAPLTSPYRRPMLGRYERLSRARLYNETVQRVRDIENGVPMETLPNSLAVFPLTYVRGDARYAPLSQGLSAMIETDLGKIDRLVLVERLQLQAVLDELDLGLSDLVDQSTAARVGHILGASHVLGGNFLVDAGGRIHVDLSLIDNTSSIEVSEDEVLEEVFALQNTLVYELMDQLNIELTPAEREAIEFIPTRDLDAYLAFGAGLAAEDEGNFALAASQFAASSALGDPFGAAVDRAELNEGLAETGATVESALTDLSTLLVNGVSQVGIRQQQLGDNLGTLVVPGEDAREPAPEATNSSNAGYLGVPPAPPPGGN